MRRMWSRYLIPSTLVVLIALCCVPAAAESEDAESGFGKYLCQGTNDGPYWPTQGWRRAKPEEFGMDSSKLAKAIEYMASPEHSTDGLAIIKNGYIVAEAYFGAFKMDEKHRSASVAKSFTSTLIGIAIDQELISGVDAKLCEYFDEWDCDDGDDLRSKITIRHALTLTTGLKWQEDWINFNPATNDAIKMGRGGNPLAYVLSKDGEHEPGTSFAYSTGDPMLLSGVISRATRMNALEFARKNLFEPMGVSSVEWRSDGHGNTVTSSSLRLTVRDYAKLGYLFLNKGKWEDRQVVSEEWVSQSTRTDPSVTMWPAYGYLWHVNLPLRLNAPDSRIPASSYMAEGVGGQTIVVMPSKDLVISKMASIRGLGQIPVEFLTLILDAVNDGAGP